MLFFGHIGITTGLALIIDALSKRSRPVQPVPFNHDNAPDGNRAANNTGRPFLDFFDLRIIMIGSLLPDIIDKPVGEMIFASFFHHNGRLFSHTILFLALILLSGYVLYRLKRQTWLLALAFGTFTHLIFDSMWNSPHTLFWPFLGASFPRGQSTSVIDWLMSLWQGLLNRPAVCIPEVTGFIILSGLAVYLVRKRRVISFLKTGKIHC